MLHRLRLPYAVGISSHVTVFRAVSTISRQPDSAIYCSDSTVRMSAVD
jgi:hypothetical protein